MTTRMTLNDIEALAVMVDVFGTQQLLDALETIAICKALDLNIFSGGAPLNSVQARIDRDTKAKSIMDLPGFRYAGRDWSPPS